MTTKLPTLTLAAMVLLAGCDSSRPQNYLVVVMNKSSKEVTDYYISVPASFDKLEVIDEFHSRVGDSRQYHSFTILNVVNISKQ